MVRHRVRVSQLEPAPPLEMAKHHIRLVLPHHLVRVRVRARARARVKVRVRVRVRGEG